MSIDLKMSLSTGIIWALAFAQFLVGNFLDFKLVRNVGIDSRLGAMKDALLRVEHQFIVLPSINPVNFNFEASFIDNSEITGLRVYSKGCWEQ
jgi:hypothetical protein